MELSLKRYLISAVKWLSLFIAMQALIIICLIFDFGKRGSLIISGIITFLFLLPFGIYYLYLFLFFKKKIKGVSPEEAIITNWQAGSFRYTGKLILNIDDKEYSTASYFSQEEAKSTVGKTVLYTIIDDTLFIYKIKD
jgi:hypothetical protein